MSLKPCSNCGRMVSTKAPRCPKCGLKDPAAGKVEQGSPMLFSPDSLRVPTFECPECHRQVRVGIKTCPYCGLKHPSERPRRQRLLLAVAVASIAAAAAWACLEWYGRRAAVESGLVTTTPRSRTVLPQVRAFGFAAQCTDPAPVYVFAAGSVPDTFVVVLASGDPVAITRGLAKKYRFTAGNYDRTRRGFAARLSPSIVAKLRCDPVVKSLEEPAKPYPERPGP
jgi:RNA polymerase subunit RPABC4/transcription elongation factor Spt4